MGTGLHTTRGVQNQALSRGVGGHGAHDASFRHHSSPIRDCALLRHPRPPAQPLPRSSSPACPCILVWSPGCGCLAGLAVFLARHQLVSPGEQKPVSHRGCVLIQGLVPTARSVLPLGADSECRVDHRTGLQCVST